MINGKKLQRRRDLEPVWVTCVQWSDNSWGLFPEMGCGATRENAMSLASKYIQTNIIKWAMGNRTKFGFSRRIKFRKYYLPVC